MKILLTSPPGKHDYGYPNIGLLSLSAYIQKYSKRHVDFKYLEGSKPVKEHLSTISDYEPDIIGLSICSMAAESAYTYIKLIKKMTASTKIVCGGPYATIAYQELLSRGNADVAVIGEGEETFLELLETAGCDLSPDNLKEVRGIAYRDVHGSIHTNPKRPLIEDLSSIPAVDLSLIDLRAYPGLHLRKMNTQLPVCISRGCPYNCTFCSNPVWKNQKPWVRTEPTHSVVSKIKSYYDSGVREIHLVSDELNCSLKYAEDICRQIVKLGLKDLYFQAYLRAKPISDELLDLLKEMNCWLVHLGIESYNNRVLDGIGKNVTTDDINLAIHKLHKRKINIFAFMMLYNVWLSRDGAIQCETKEEVDHSLMVMKNFLALNMVSYMSWQIATPMPGSILHQIVDGNNLWLENMEGNKFRDILIDYPRITNTSLATISNQIKRGLLIKGFYFILHQKFAFFRIIISNWWRVVENIRVMLSSR